MNIRVIRVLLVVVAIAVVSAASYFLRQTDSALSNDRAVADSLRNQTRTLAALIAEMRTAQVAYVARGQGEDFWIGRVANLLPGVQQQMIDFGSQLAASAAQSAFEPALAAIENFQKLDHRAQDFVKADNALLAADLIFSDGLEATATATTQLDAALNEELQARQAAAAAERAMQLTILGGSAAGVLLIMVILAFAGGSRKVVEPLPATLPVAQQPETVSELKPPAVNLSHAAQLCTDLGCVADSKQLPGLLERAAGVLDSAGIIVWVADPVSNSLRAAMSFGYSDQVLTRMGNIHRDANNAVAAAVRLGEMRMVDGDTSTSGALVMPLLTSDGCIGALSAEMKGGSERDESSQAFAAIFAAQLATLVTPSLAAAQVKATAHA
jgi:GAF domain-containing protein